MSEFSQNGVVATLHDFSNRDIDKIENDLELYINVKGSWSRVSYKN